MLKYKFINLFLLVIFMCTFTLIKASNEPLLLGKVIYIDPGHGGVDPGATYKEIKESKINLQISKYLEESLENQGAIVYMTRVEDNDLSETNTKNKKRNDLTARARLINESKADMFISIHLNSDTSPTWSGTQIFYTEKNKENKKIAEIIQQQFKENLKTKREAKKIDNTYLYEKIIIPGVLIEAGFLSNPNDRYLLINENHQKKIASTITSAIIKYYK